MGTIEPKSFRDRPINIDETGDRKWIYAKQPSGPWYRRRTLFSVFLLLFFVLAPIIKINGNPLMLIDIANRRFSIFGNMIWSHDTHILAVIMAVTIVFIVLFTVVFGRLWCGWACPQTVFLEMIYRRIEYLFDGNYRKKRKTISASGKNILKVLKHLTFFTVSIILTNIFLMWFTGPERLIEIISSPYGENLKGFLIMLAISTFYYFIYSYFREQVCTMICPYGRLQGVLLDSRSITVTYDYKRGEPRGARNSGDCIDCKQCLSVCPTGIDIRNGTQLECVNCTACIDECNNVMKKIKKPPNLIRFDSHKGIETGKNAILNTRTLAYSIVLAVLLFLLAFTVIRRAEVETNILRVPGTMYQEIDSVTFSNIYNTKILNKSEHHMNLHLKLISPYPGELQLTIPDILLDPGSSYESILIIKLPNKSLSGKSTEVKIGIFEGETQMETLKINFIGPSTDL